MHSLSWRCVNSLLGVAEIRDPALYGTELVKGATATGMLCPLKLCMKLHQLGELLTRLGSATLVKLASLWVYSVSYTHLTLPTSIVV